MPLPTRSSLVALLTLVAAVPFVPLAAQLPAVDGLPAHAPINPTSARRTGLFAPSYLTPHDGWRFGVSLDYANAIEVAPLREDGTRYLLDAEVMRVQLDAAHDLGDATFIGVSLQAGGMYDGVLDGMIDWVHARMGYHMEGRETRPRNSFADTLILAGGAAIVREKSRFHLGDARVTIGRRHDTRQQTLLSVTLPTSTGRAGSGRGVPSFAVIHTMRAPFGSRWLYEGSAGLGYTPAHGALAGMQREVLASASSGLRVRIGDSHALYYFLFFHSPYYTGTAVPELEGPELSQDLGWIVRTQGGREWRVGLTEDVMPDDQALDVVFKIGVAW